MTQILHTTLIFKNDETLVYLKKIPIEYLTNLSKKDTIYISRLISHSFILSGDNSLINYSFNLVKKNKSPYSIDILLKIYNFNTHHSGIYLKRLYFKNGG